MAELQNTEKFCANCGTKINSKAVICPSCGVKQATMDEDVSSMWYLVPLFFFFVGGIVAWAVNKDRNPKKARNMMIFGILWTVIFTIIWMLFGLLLIGSMSGPYRGY